MVTVVVTSEALPGQGEGTPLTWAALERALKERDCELRWVPTPLDMIYTDTANQDRADLIVKAIDGLDDIVVLGVSNQGLFLPLIADARPVRRLVYVNALVPTPGQPIMATLQSEDAFAPGLLDATIASVDGVTAEFLKLVADPNMPTVPDDKLEEMAERARAAGARSSIGPLLEPCPLDRLPDVDNVYICAANDNCLRPEWQQRAARERLGIEAVVIEGATHAGILMTHPNEVADAVTRGL